MTPIGQGWFLERVSAVSPRQPTLPAAGGIRASILEERSQRQATASPASSAFWGFASSVGRLLGCRPAEATLSPRALGSSKPTHGAKPAAEGHRMARPEPPRGPSRMTLGTRLHLFVPQFLHLSNRDKISTYLMSSCKTETVHAKRVALAHHMQGSVDSGW